MQSVDQLAKNTCERVGINADQFIKKQIDKAIDAGCNLADIESAINHLVSINPNMVDPITEISLAIKAQSRAASTKTQVGFGKWDYISENAKKERHLTERDFEILQALYHHHYLDRNMLGQMFFTGDSDLKDFQGTAKTAIKRLYQAGVLMRLREFKKTENNPHVHLPAIYTLSKDGYMELAKNGLVADYDAHYQPLPLRASSKINMTHELAVNRFCVQIIQYAINIDVEVDWWASDEAYQKVPARTPGQMGIAMEPDSVLWINKGLVVLVELEHSGRRKQMLNRLRRWKRYIAMDGWRGYYPFTPWLLFVVPLINIHNGATLQKISEIATSVGIRANKVALIPEEGPVNDQWTVYLFLDGEMGTEDFWDWAQNPKQTLSGKY